MHPPRSTFLAELHIHIPITTRDIIGQGVKATRYFVHTTKTMRFYSTVAPQNKPTNRKQHAQSLISISCRCIRLISSDLRLLVNAADQFICEIPTTPVALWSIETFAYFGQTTLLIVLSPTAIMDENERAFATVRSWVQVIIAKHVGIVSIKYYVAGYWIFACSQLSKSPASYSTDIWDI